MGLLDECTGPFVWLDGCWIGLGDAISMLTSQAEFQTICAAYQFDIDKQIYQFLSCMYNGGAGNSTIF